MSSYFYLTLDTTPEAKSYFYLILDTTTKTPSDRVYRFISHIYDSNIAMQAIAKTMNLEIDAIEQKAEGAFRNTFITTSNETGVRQYENILSIRPNISQESLEIRKQRVINTLSSVIPFTRVFLERKLEATFGSGNWFLEIDYDNFIAAIEIITDNVQLYKLTMDNIREIIPANMELIASELKPYTHGYLAKFYTHAGLEKFTQGELSQFAT